MTLETLTLIIALWGAGLSTILGIRELRRDRRSLKIILEWVYGSEIYRILITNTGHRPITISEIVLDIKHADRGYNHHLNPSDYWENMWNVKDNPPTLPHILQDGELAIFYVSTIISSEINKEVKNRLIIKIYDAEGHIYTNYSEGEYDPKEGYRIVKNNLVSVISRLKTKRIKPFPRLKR